MERPPVDLSRLHDDVDSRWARVDVVDEVPSTNAVLLADQAAPDRSVLVAEHQSAGRGRLDRSWTSPRGAGLTFSVLFRPSAGMLHWGWLSLLAGVALAEAVTEHTGVATSLKWPNDLLAGPAGHKVAGILAQSSGDVVVIGIGLNVSTTPDELPTPASTSLAAQGPTSVDRTALLSAVLRRLDAREAQWDDCRGDAEACGLAEAYRAACATLGATVRITLSAAGEAVEGTAVDVDAGGRLVVRTATGERAVGAGDVEHLRRR